MTESKAVLRVPSRQDKPGLIGVTDFVAGFMLWFKRRINCSTFLSQNEDINWYNVKTKPFLLELIYINAST